MAKVTRVEDEQAFWFKDWDGNVDYVAHDLKEFKQALKTVPEASLEFHLREDKNDFSSWLENMMNQKRVADEMWSIKNRCLTGEDLRRSLIRCFKPRRAATSSRKKSKSLKHSLRRALVGKR